MDDDTGKPRRPWMAGLLALPCTGLGHVYVGRPARGATLFLAGLFFLPIWVIAAFFPPATPVLILLLVTGLAWLPIWLISIVDAVRLARRHREGVPLRGWNHVGVYILGAALGLTAPAGGVLLARAATFEAYHIPTMSMAPTIVDGDRVLVNRMAVRVRRPVRWEIAVFRHPNDPTKTHIKRIVGLPGDRISDLDGRLVINGTVIDGPLGEVADRPLRDLVVPPGSYWVLGDNRPNSWDSRSWGVVPASSLVGAAQYLLTSADRFGAL